MCRETEDTLASVARSFLTWAGHLGCLTPHLPPAQSSEEQALHRAVSSESLNMNPKGSACVMLMLTDSGFVLLMSLLSGCFPERTASLVRRNSFFPLMDEDEHWGQTIV